MAAFERALRGGGRRARRRSCSTRLLRAGARRGQPRARGGDWRRGSSIARRQPPERARRLREAAALDAALGQDRLGAWRGCARRWSSIRSTHETLAGLSAMLVQRRRATTRRRSCSRARCRCCRRRPTAERARRARVVVDAPRRVPRAAARRQGRGGRVREGARGRSVAASAARDAAASATATIRRTTTWCARITCVILADDPLHAPSLRAIGAHRRAQQERATAGGASSSCWRWRAPSPTTSGAGWRRWPPEPIDDAQSGTLDEDDHALLAHPDALPLAPVFAALWEGTAAERAPDLGVARRARPTIASRRSAGSELARAYALVLARARQPQDRRSTSRPTRRPTTWR